MHLFHLRHVSSFIKGADKRILILTGKKTYYLPILISRGKGVSGVHKTIYFMLNFFKFIYYLYECLKIGEEENFFQIEFSVCDLKKLKNYGRGSLDAPCRFILPK